MDAIFSPYTGLLLSLPHVFKALCTDHPDRSVHPVNVATPRHLHQRVPEPQLLTASISTHPQPPGLKPGISPSTWAPEASEPHLFPFVVVQRLSCVRLFATPWTAASQGSLSFPISLSLLTLMSIELVMPSNHLILCRPLLLLPSIFPASGSFPVSWLFASAGQSIRASASASALPMNI